MEHVHAKKKKEKMKASTTRKIENLKKLTTDPKSELVNALSAFDESDFSDNGNVRSMLEELELKHLNQFIEKFSKLTDTLGTVYNTIGELDQSCDSMLTKLSIGQRNIDEVLDMTTSLYTQQEKQRQQLTKIHAFIEEYYLSEDDFKTLENGDINDQFFEAFSRLEQSQDRTTLAITTSQTRCLVDASNALNAAKENAYQRIYRYLHLNSHIFSHANPTIPELFNRCIATIKQKPFIYSFIVTGIAKERNSVLLLQFSKFLEQRKAQDIETNFEPLVFTSDILAWVHQTSATESAFLASIFNEQQNSTNITNAMGTATEAFCTPIERNVSQIIKDLTRPSDIYQMANIIAFYFSTFSDLCGIRSPLATALKNLKQSATEEFRKSITGSVEGLRNESKPSVGAIKEALRVINEVTDLHKKASLSVAFDVASLIETFAQELKESINNSKESQSFKANCLYELLLVCKDGNLKCTEDVEKEFVNIKDQIVTLETKDILQRCRILDLLNLFNEPTETPLSMVKGAEEKFVREAIKRFETTLVGTGRILTPKCDDISNPELKKQAKDAVAQLLIKAYSTLYNSVTDPRNAYTNPVTMFTRTPQLIQETIMI